MIGVGTSSAKSAYAAAGYSTGGSTILKTTDGGATFSKIKTRYTPYSLSGPSNSPFFSVSSCLIDFYCPHSLGCTLLATAMAP